MVVAVAGFMNYFSFNLSSPLVREPHRRYTYSRDLKAVKF